MSQPIEDLGSEFGLPSNDPDSNLSNILFDDDEDQNRPKSSAATVVVEPSSNAGKKPRKNSRRSSTKRVQPINYLPSLTIETGKQIDCLAIQDAARELMKVCPPTWGTNKEYYMSFVYYGILSMIQTQCLYPNKFKGPAIMADVIGPLQMSNMASSTCGPFFTSKDKSVLDTLEPMVKDLVNRGEFFQEYALKNLK